MKLFGLQKEIKKMGLKVTIIVLGILLALVAGALIVFGSVLTSEVKRLKKLLSDTQFQKTELEKKNILLNYKIEKIQTPNLVNIYPEVYNIIAAWCKEVGIYQVAIKTKYDSKSDCYKLILYTERPGAFIGKAGSTIEKYKKMLQECKVGRMIEQIEIEEISGIVNQNKVNVDNYYNSYMANWFAYEEAGEEC